MSADPERSMGEDDQDQILAWEMAALPPSEEPDWYAGDALGTGRPGKSLTPAIRPGRPWTPAIRAMRARLRASRSRRAAGPTPSRPTRSWLRWSISSSVMAWAGWMMIS